MLYTSKVVYSTSWWAVIYDCGISWIHSFVFPGYCLSLNLTIALSDWQILSASQMTAEPNLCASEHTSFCAKSTHICHIMSSLKHLTDGMISSGIYLSNGKNWMGCGIMDSGYQLTSLIIYHHGLWLLSRIPKFGFCFSQNDKENQDTWFGYDWKLLYIHIWNPSKC